MPNDSDAGTETTKLAVEASHAERRGNVQQALDLLERAISIAERNGIPPFFLKYKRQRMLNRSHPDVSKLLSIIEDEVAFYREHGEIRPQIDALLHLATSFAAFNKPVEALQSLSELEVLIDSLSSIELENLSKRRIAFCRDEITRLRKILRTS